MSIPRILIVDDEEGIRDLVSMYLEKEGFKVILLQMDRPL